MEILSTIATVLIIFTTVLYAYQFIYMFLPLIPRKKKHKELKMHRYGILIPARNEKNVIGHLLESIAAQDYPRELIKVYVIADNCTDNTAQIAREHGATVFERFNKKQVGKGYALEYLLEQIRDTEGLEQHDVFMIFDSDNLLEPDYISQINQTFSDGYQAACGFRNTKNYGSNWVSAGYGIWYLHDSAHLNRSRSWLNLCAGVSGTGFGFTRQLLESLGGWKFFTLTEDLEFNAWCASHGVKIGYCHDAALYDEQPITLPVSWKQRIRWVQGGFQVALKHTKNMLKGLFKGRWQTFSCLECLSLTPWGALIATTGCVLSFLSVLLGAGIETFLWSILTAFGGALLGMIFMGAITVAMTWKRIRATTAQKLWSIPAFIPFMITFTLCLFVAPFCKFQWLPVEHTVAMGNEGLHKTK